MKYHTRFYSQKCIRPEDFIDLRKEEDAGEHFYENPLRGKRTIEMTI